MHRAITAKTEVVHHRCSVKLFQWEMHSDQECKVCKHFEISGTLRRHTAGRGRLPGATPNMLIKYLKEIAPTPVFEHHPPVSSQNNPSILEQLTCRVCLKILQKPLKLLCGALACAQCIVERVATSTTLQCPCCSSDAHLVPSHIRPAPDLILVLLNDILVLCVKCNREMKAHSYEGHECTSCLTASEERTVAGNLKRAVSTSPDKTNDIHTGDQIPPTNHSSQFKDFEDKALRNADDTQCSRCRRATALIQRDVLTLSDEERRAL
ncbi:hypothetical protein EMCRGX_G022831 [Ephydatia muelleri]|eukprot:Em0017g797a